MKLKTEILAIFLVVGLLGIPNCIFAQQYEDSTSDAVIQSNLQSTMLLNSLTPLVRRGGGGRGARKAVRNLDGVDDYIIHDDHITLIVLFGIICVLVWYFVLRK